MFSSFFCLAIREGQQSECILPQIGAGCSQSILLALSRAVFELKQAESLYGYEERLVDEQAVRIIKRSKRLEGLRNLYPRSVCGSSEIPQFTVVDPRKPGRQLEKIVGSLKSRGYRAYYRVVRKINDHSFVAQV
ncbi:YcaO-like family protein [Pseudomonas sp. Q1-7]|uniref:YcaO-like family protein n=1 Tax=Pseudomonas sp. Q1-7 TaxID=3020843 RepID=UPI003FA6932E